MIKREEPRILCGCLCDAPLQQMPMWKRVSLGLIVSVGLLGLLSLLSSCSPTEAKAPSHTLEIGDPVLARSSFPSKAACEEFADRLIVVLHKAKKEIPEPMRCN